MPRNKECVVNVNIRRKRVIQLAVLMVLVSFLTTTTLSVRSLDALIRSNAQSLTSLLSSSIYDAVRSDLTKPSMVARTISCDTFLINLLRIEQAYTEDYIAYRLNTYLTGIRKGIDFASAFIVPNAGRRLYGLDARVRQLDPQTVAQDAVFDKFISSGRPRVPVVHMDAFHPDRQMFFIFSRIADEEGKVVGMCGVGEPLEQIQGVLRGFEQKYGVQIRLVDWDERCMLSTTMPADGGKVVEGLPAGYRQHRDFVYAEDGRGGYVITRYLDEIGWFLVIRGEKTEGREAFSSLIVENIVAIVVIFSLLFIAMHFLMRSERMHLERKAFTDELTGIANRAGFEAALEQEFRRTERGALFILDLDHFKEVNDNLGHPEGDALLRRTAQNLKAVFRSSDIVARLGGDEFVVFAAEIQQTDLLAATAGRIREAVMQRYTLPGGQLLTVTASIGVALYPRYGSSYEMLYKNADAALYAAKEGGRDRFTIFTGER